MGRRAVMVLALTLVVVAAAPTHAEWSSDPSANLPVDTLAYVDGQSVVPDGSGGVIAVWVGYRDGIQTILAQRIDSSGQPLWLSGIPFESQVGVVSKLPVVSDGAGGAIIAWAWYADNGTARIFAQRINGSGELQWAPGGVLMCSSNSVSPRIASDGAGGAIVAWADLRTVVDFHQAFDKEVYAQRVSASGVPLWTTNGVQLTSAPGQYLCWDIASDATGGAVLAWFGAPHGADEQIYAQRLTAAGAPAWGAAGVTVCSAPGDQSYPRLAVDGSGGAFVAWIDARSAVSYSEDLYAQHLDAAGNPVLTADGTGLCTVSGGQYVTGMLSDGVGGAFVTWNDTRTGTPQVYAQHMDPSGAATWAEGVCMATGAEGQDSNCLAADGVGGVYVAWVDSRGGSRQVFGQHLASSGAKAWGADGLQISSASGGQYLPDIAPESGNRATVIWQDFREQTAHLFAQGLNSGGLGGNAVAGVLPIPSRDVVFAPVGANPSADGRTRVRFSLSGMLPASIEVLDVTGRRIESQSVTQLGAGVHELELTSLGGAAPGIYLILLHEGARVESTRVARLR